MCAALPQGVCARVGFCWRTSLPLEGFPRLPPFRLKNFEHLEVFLVCALIYCFFFLFPWHQSKQCIMNDMDDFQGFLHLKKKIFRGLV